MFLDNKYTKYYYNIINNSKTRTIDGYTENHHIIPKSLGGDDNKDNLVFLTSKEHYIVHHLLTKMLEGDKKYKMINAFWLMTISDNFKITSIQYAQARKEHSLLMKEKWKNPNSSYNSLDYRAKNKKICLDNNNSLISKQKKFNKKAKEYIITNPQGISFKIKGLDKFCKENGLHTGNMSSVANGKLKQCNGWTCQYILDHN